MRLFKILTGSLLGWASINKPAIGEPAKFKNYTGVFRVDSGDCDEQRLPASVAVSYQINKPYQGPEGYGGEDRLIVIVRTADGRTMYNWDLTDYSLSGEGRFSYGQFKVSDQNMTHKRESNNGYAKTEIANHRDGSYSFLRQSSGWPIGTSCNLRMTRMEVQ